MSSVKPPARKPRRRRNPNRGPPIAPHLKIILRNLSDRNRCGSVEQIVALVRDVVQTANNEKLDVKLQLDETSLQRAILQDQAVKAARRVWEQESNGEIQATTQESKQEMDEIVQKLKALSLENVSTQVSSSTLSCRLLYIVTPKQTRRRGDKPGCAYLVLTSSPIQANPIPETESINLPNYSKELAARKLLLERTLEVLQAIATNDAKTKQDFGGCAIEEAMDAKIWKHNIKHRNRLEGTIFESDDYVKFTQNQQQEKEMRASRPKPPPGGGMASLSSSQEQTPKVAALVQHLRAQREAQKKGGKRKQATKKPEQSTETKKGAHTNKHNKKKGTESKDKKGGQKGTNPGG